MGLDIDLYTPKIDIGDDNADDIIIEITGLKSINKFIGLEDTPLYYDNGKFFKVENNKIVYTDIQWKDISGKIEDAPEIVAFIKDLIEEISAKVVDDHIYLHDIAEDAHPYIQNIIHENYETLDTKIDNTREELSQDISNLNNALNQEISDRTSADTTLQNNIDAEALTRQNADITLQGNIDTLSDTVSSNYETLDTKIDNTKNTLDGEIEEINRRMIDTIQGDELIEVSRENNTVSLNSKSFVFEQGIPATEWVINHNLNKQPSVTLTNSNGQRFYAFWEYPNNNQVIIKLDSATTGFAYLN